MRVETTSTGKTEAATQKFNTAASQAARRIVDADDGAPSLSVTALCSLNKCTA